jgi:hypothetical protein
MKEAIVFDCSVVDNKESWEKEKKVFLGKLQKWNKTLDDCFQTETQPYINRNITKGWVVKLVDDLVDEVLSDTKELFLHLSPAGKKAFISHMCSHAAELYCVLINARDTIKNLEKSYLPVLMIGMTDLIVAFYFPIIYPVVDFFTTYYQVKKGTFSLSAPLIYQRRELFLSYNTIKQVYVQKYTLSSYDKPIELHNLLIKGDLECCFLFFEEQLKAVREKNFSFGAVFC